MARRGFTLIEMLIVIAVVGLLVSLLLPTLAGARRKSRRIQCLANLRSLETAHWNYLADSSGQMLGTSHGNSWFATLKQYDDALLLRSPVDTSSHFPGGTPINGKYRQTTYALNFWLSPDNPSGYSRVSQVDQPAATVHFVIKVFEGKNAVADHVHPHLWFSPINADASAAKAALEVQTNAHGGNLGTWEAISNYGFLDGSAKTLRFDEVYRDREQNQFNPAVAR